MGRPLEPPAPGETSRRPSLPERGDLVARVPLAVVDLAGRRLRVLQVGWLAAGERTAAWDGADPAGRRCPPGVYYDRLEAEGRTLSKSTIRLR